MELLTDTELVKASQEGERLAFDVLVKRHRAKLYNRAMQLLKDPDLAEDVVQDSLIRAYNGIGSFGLKSSFRTWASQIVTRQCFTVLEDRKKDNRAPLVVDKNGDEADAALLIRDQHPAADPERAVLNQELRDHIQAALKLLTKREKEVFALRYYEGLRSRAVGELLGITEGTVRVALARVVKKLRVQLRAYAEAA